MIYRYPELQTEYKRYIKNTSLKSIKLFGITVDELKQKSELTEEEAEFLTYYYKLMPVSLASSTMNRICWYIEQHMNEHYDKLKGQNVDYTKYKYKNIQKSEEVTEIVKKLYQAYVQTISNRTTDIQAIKAAKEFYSNALKNLNKNKQVLNSIIDLIQTSKTAKAFLWDCATEMFLERLEGLYDSNE